jgi:glycosyltransferase involved in cell wall biosynthesis
MEFKLLQLASANIVNRSGGMSLRNYYLARQLAKIIDVTHLSFGESEQIVRTTCLHESIKTTIVPRDRAYTVAKLARGAFGSIPVTLLNFCDTDMVKELANELATTYYDTVLIEGIEMSPYLRVIRAAKPPATSVVLDWHNIESEVVSRHANHAASPLHQLYMRRTSSQLKRIERDMLDKCDLHIVTSERDREELLTRRPTANVAVIENGVEVSNFTPGLPDLEHTESWNARRRILFVGSMDYSANVDAVMYFVEQIWPRIQRELPDLVFTVVGRNPPKRVRTMATRPGIEVTGTVQDVRPYYSRALVAVVPLRVGGGTRLKILEAMAAGIPVVSTRVGAEGLRLDPKAHFMVAETSADFCDRIGRLRTEFGLWCRLSAAGRKLVEASYDWNSIGRRFEEIYVNFVRGRQEVADCQFLASAREA